MIFKCKMCGGDITPIEGTNTGKCEYCKSLMTLPNLDNEKIVNLYNRANDLRLSNEFDKAYGVYETILELDNNQVEAHWGILLCKYGVEYIDDPKTKLKIPTCHRTIQESILKDSEYKYIKENAFGDALKLYEDEAKRIDEIQKGILEISSKEEPYDIFICYKETDENGERTHDSVIAQDIYDKLIEKNYKVFFARVTLEDKLGTQYEPYIYSALNSSKVMLVVGTSDVHLNSVWVKNEWSRYLEMMKFDKSKMIVPVYSKMDAYKLPEEFVMFQAQSMDKVGAMQDLIRGIDKIINEAKETPKNDVDKIKKAMEEASNLGNGKYEIVVMREKTFTFYYVLMAIMLIGFFVSSFVSILYSVKTFDAITIYDFYVVSILPIILKFFAIITGGTALIMSFTSRKNYKRSKFIMLGALCLELIKAVICGIYGFVDVNIIPILIECLHIIIKPKWHIDTSLKLIVDREKKNEINEKNKKMVMEFIEKDKTIIPVKYYFIFAIVAVIFLIIDLIIIFKVPQSNKINENINQVKIINDNVYIYEKSSLRGTKLTKINKDDYYDIINVVEGNKDVTYINDWYDKYYIKTNQGIKGYVSQEDVEIVYNKNHALYGKKQSNERNPNVLQVRVITESLKIRNLPNGNVVGTVKEGEIYTVLDVYEGYTSTRWYKIKTGLNIEGYIGDSFENSYYLERLEPANY